MDWKNIINQCINLLYLMGRIFWWLAPLAIFLLATFIPRIAWNLSFENYLDFLRILIWPSTALITLFFFRKVITYLFFSLDGFNFWGIKGELKNVYDMITEEVDKKFLEEKREKERKEAMDRLSENINKKDNEIKKAKGTAGENLYIAKEIMKEWKKSTEQNKKIINDLDEENKRLKNIISSLPLDVNEVNSLQNVDDSKTSDPILDESNIKNNNFKLKS